MLDQKSGSSSDASPAPDTNSRLPAWIVAWFVIDAFVALAPPTYLAPNGMTEPLLGLPPTLVYFLAVGACITSSIVAAYWCEAASGGSGGR